MKKLLTILFCGLLFIGSSQAQEHKWAFGFYGDVQMESPTYYGSFGVQGKYDLTNYQALQAQVYGRGGYIAVGADYLVNVFNKEKSNFNIFLGPGISQDFYTYDFTIDGDVEGPIRRKENYTNAIGQVGVSYYFPSVDLSIYTGYKLKYQFASEAIDPNYVMLGVRYHIW